VAGAQAAAAVRRAGVKRLLLSVLGDLEEVWADAALQEVLLGLPLPAMELLLGCDDLKVRDTAGLHYTATYSCDAQSLYGALSLCWLAVATSSRGGNSKPLLTES
jgi:hypothetical protein